MFRCGPGSEAFANSVLRTQPGTVVCTPHCGGASITVRVSDSYVNLTKLVEGPVGHRKTPAQKPNDWLEDFLHRQCVVGVANRVRATVPNPPRPPRAAGTRGSTWTTS